MKRPTWRTTVALGVAATLAACADGTLPQMAASDPANPRAPESPPSATATPAAPMPSSAPGPEHPQTHAQKVTDSP